MRAEISLAESWDTALAGLPPDWSDLYGEVTLKGTLCLPRTPGREKAVGTAENGYLHCGPSGAGHFVKMVHNGIEYGLMAAYAEGFNILNHASIGKKTQDVDAETTPLRKTLVNSLMRFLVMVSPNTS